MIDKIIERLEAEFIPEIKDDYDVGRNRGIDKAISIVKEVATEGDSNTPAERKGYTVIDEITRQALVDRLANIISDYEERELSETDIEELNYEDLQCLMECLQFAQLKQKGDWIKCSDDFPKFDQEVYVTLENGEAITSKFYGFGEECQGYKEFPTGVWEANQLGYEVIAWQPLPKSFKESD